MTPQEVFGLLVRFAGLVVVLYSLRVLAQITVAFGGPVATLGVIVGSWLIGVYLLRPSRLVRYSYPGS